jgi:DNA topoisomerase II
MTQNSYPITQFFSNEYVNYASYDNYRKIACYIDGLKPSARKVTYTVRKHKIDSPIKVSTLGSKVVETCAYIHGESSLYGVIIGLAQNFSGINNLPLLTRDGNFGNRMIPSAAAPRYIKTFKEKYFDLIFNPDDDAVLIEQIFENEKIEPRFFVPVIPLLLVNGSEGISTGFAQKILSRNPVELCQVIKNNLYERIGQQASIRGKKRSSDTLPYFHGFSGTVEKGEEPQKWNIKGKIERLHTTKIRIVEIPPWVSLEEYKNTLNKLEEMDVIKSYNDMTDGEHFLFELFVTREFTSNNTDEQILEKLKLIERVSENYTCLDDNLAIIEFKQVDEIMDKFIDTRIKFLAKRKSFILGKLKDKLIFLKSKWIFIKSVVEEKIKINRVPENEVIDQIEKTKGIEKVNGTYNFLLSIPVSSFTEEKYKALEKEISDCMSAIRDLQEKKIEEIWIEEIEKLLPILKS